MRKKELGFAHLSMVLLLVAILAVGAAGFYVLKQNKSSNSASQQQAAKSDGTAKIEVNGTSENLLKEVNSSSTIEQTIDDDALAADEDAAESVDSTAINAIGDGVDEVRF